MSTWMIGGIFLLFAFVTSLILPWINRSAIGELRGRVAWLQDEINRLKKEGIKTAAQSPTAAHFVPPIAEERPETIAPPLVVLQDAARADDFAAEQAVPGLHTAPVAIPAQNKTLEQQFGGQAFVWMGGVALALAGFFLVKYSIESGLLTEKVRVVLGLLFGFVLLGGSHIVRQHPRIADGTRISQALAGAGIADLYGCLFAATTLYHLIPSWFGFACMTAVTGMTLLLSLSYGAPIAALGLIGGFATPMLIHGNPNAPLLFGYLYLVFGSLIAVARRQDWWWLSIPATLVAFLWVIVWLFSGLAAADGIWLALFLLGISAAVVAMTRGIPGDDAFGPPAWLRYIAIGGSLLLMGTVTYTAHFGPFEWDMFGLLSVAAIALAWFDNRTYSFAPWLAMGTNAVMLLTWDYADPAAFAVAVGIFGFTFIASGHLLAARSKNAVSWASLSAASAFVYYLLAYSRLNAALPSLIGMRDWLSSDQLWAVLAFVLAAFFTTATMESFVTQLNMQLRHRLQTIFTVAASGFLSLGLAILLHQEYLAFAIAAQILTISWINTKVDIPALRSIAQVLTALFVLLLLPEVLTLLTSSLDDVSGYGGSRLSKLHTVSSLLFQFGWPSVMFAGASWLLRAERDDEFVAVLELAAIILFGAMSYDLIGTLFENRSYQSAFIARGIFTNVLLFLSLAALRASRQYSRPAVEWGGLVLGGLAMARIAGFDLLFHNPLWSRQMVGELPLLNGLILAYGLPTLSIVLIKNELSLMGRTELARIGKIIAFVLAFVFVSLNVRQFYHGAYLDRGMVSNAEVYTYSAAWLALGAALLFAGTVRQDGAMRVASLVIMLLTVGKVFLYDASELTGLWRVFSFFGLGISLLVLSWFYSRFVFNIKKQKSIS